MRRGVRMNRTVAGIISVILLFLIVLGLLIILFVQLADTVADLAAGIPGLYYAKVLPGITEFFAKVEELAGRIDESLLEMVQSAVPNILSSVGSTVTEASARWWLDCLRGVPAAGDAFEHYHLSDCHGFYCGGFR